MSDWDKQWRGYVGEASKRLDVTGPNKGPDKHEREGWVKKEKKSLEGWILDYEEKNAVLESEISDLKCGDELNTDKILDKVDELEFSQRRLKQGQELMDELF